MRLSIAAIASFVVLQSLSAQGLPEGVEPNDTLANLANIPTLPAGVQAYGILTAGDEDWYQLNLTSTSDLLIFTGPGFPVANQAGDTRVRLYDAAGTLIIDQDDGFGNSFYTKLVRGSQAAGTYYLGVKHYSATGTGGYTLEAVVAAPGTYVAAPYSGPLAPITEAAEVNDPRVLGGVATVSVINSQNSGANATAVGGTSFTSATGDYDFFEIVVPTAGTLTASTNVVGAPAPAMLDTVVHIADAAFTRLAYHDDINYPANALSTVSYNVTVPGTYYVVVSGYDTGNYLLNVTLAPVVPTGPATVSMQVGGCLGTAGIPALGTRLSSTGTAFYPERPIQGTTFYLDGTNLPANAAILRVLGFGALPVPFDLTGLGAPGCQIEADPLSVVLSFADASGVAFWDFALPVGTTFTGLPLVQQLAVLDAGANALGVTTSNRVQSVVGITH